MTRAEAAGRRTRLIGANDGVTNKERERKMKRMLIVGATVIAFGLAGFAGSVEATKETPNGWCGALNMVVSAPGLGVHNENGVGVQPGGGMERGMTVDNPNGNAGMDTAAELSGGFQCLGIP